MLSFKQTMKYKLNANFHKMYVGQAFAKFCGTNIDLLTSIRHNLYTCSAKTESHFGTIKMNLMYNSKRLERFIQK